MMWSVDAAIVTVWASGMWSGFHTCPCVCRKENDNITRSLAVRLLPRASARLHPLHVRPPAHSLSRFLVVSFSALSLTHAKSLQRLWH